MPHPTRSSRRHLPARSLLMLALTALVGSCGGDSEIPEGGDCQLCRSTTPTCDSGLSCRRFQSSVTFYSLCAKPTTESCPVPF